MVSGVQQNATWNPQQNNDGRSPGNLARVAESMLKRASGSCLRGGTATHRPALLYEWRGKNAGECASHRQAEAGSEGDAVLR